MKIKNGIERELGKIKRKEDRFLREEPKKENEKLESVKGKIKENDWRRGPGKGSAGAEPAGRASCFL